MEDQLAKLRKQAEELSQQLGETHIVGQCGTIHSFAGFMHCSRCNVKESPEETPEH